MNTDSIRDLPEVLHSSISVFNGRRTLDQVPKWFCGKRTPGRPNKKDPHYGSLPFTARCVFLVSTPPTQDAILTIYFIFRIGKPDLNCLPLFPGGPPNDVARDQRRQAWPFGTELCEVCEPGAAFEGEVPNWFHWLFLKRPAFWVLFSHLG